MTDIFTLLSGKGGLWAGGILLNIRTLQIEFKIFELSHCEEIICIIEHRTDMTKKNKDNITFK